MILEEETYKRFGYYSWEWKQHSSKRIIAACDDCGKIRDVMKEKYRKFCPSCARKGKRNHFFGRTHTQKTKDMIGTSNTGRDITEETRSKFRKLTNGAKNPNWRGGKIKTNCSQCGKPIAVPRYRYKKTKNGHFCSASCSRRFTRKLPKHKTAPEVAFESICKKHNLGFHYVGDGSLWIGRTRALNPDFIETNGKKICIEIFGDYWHSPMLNRNIQETARLDYRKRHYKKFGWKPIFIWETDLKRSDADAFTLNQIRKETNLK